MVPRFPTIEVEVYSSNPLSRLGLMASLGDLDEFDVIDASAPVDDAGSFEAPFSDRSRGRLRVRLYDGDPPASLVETEDPFVALVDGPEMALRASRRGAAGVVMRDGSPPRMVAALRAAALGFEVRDRAFRVPEPEVEPELELRTDLSPREREALNLLAQGFSNRRIARRLGISEHTAKFHVNRVMEKLDARSRTDAAVRGLRAGLVVF